MTPLRQRTKGEEQKKVKILENCFLITLWRTKPIGYEISPKLKKKINRKAANIRYATHTTGKGTFDGGECSNLAKSVAASVVRLVFLFFCWWNDFCPMWQVQLPKVFCVKWSYFHSVVFVLLHLLLLLPLYRRLNYLLTKAVKINVNRY